MIDARLTPVMVGAISSLLLIGCASSAPYEGATATWHLVEPEAVSSTSLVLSVAVTRLGCADGRTGTVLEPRLTYEADRILIRTDVAALDGNHECPGNDAVAVTIDLSEPVGDRQLVDGACLDTEASDTPFCSNDGVRWPPSRS